MMEPQETKPFFWKISLLEGHLFPDLAKKGPEKENAPPRTHRIKPHTCQIAQAITAGQRGRLRSSQLVDPCHGRSRLVGKIQGLGQVFFVDGAAQYVTASLHQCFELRHHVPATPPPVMVGRIEHKVRNAVDPAEVTEELVRTVTEMRRGDYQLGTGKIAL